MKAFFIIIFICLLSTAKIIAESEEEYDTDFAEDCCSDGVEWAEATGKCEPPEDPDRTTICLNTAMPCCTKKLEDVANCEEGIKISMEFKNCEKTTEGQKRDCCEECNIGIIIGKSQDCGEPKNTTYSKCCIFSREEQKLLTSTTTESTTTTTKTSTTTSTTSKPASKYSPPDLDGCELEGAVLCAHKCVPMGKSYKCQCRNGFKLHNDGKSCLKMDSNRCAKQNPCQQKCTDTGEAIVCSCRAGYELMADNVSCIDIDECRLETHTCKSGTVCVNTQGGHRCVAEPKDIEEDTDSGRYETPASRGGCPKGFKLNKLNQVCDDIDECKTNPCPLGRVCVNAIGSFNCGHGGGISISPSVPSLESIPEDANIEKDIGITDDNCPPGFMLDREIGECADIDECAEKTDDCNRKSQFCLNTHGRFTCQDKASKTSCPLGFKMRPEFGCEDIDECAENPDICTPDTVCVNEPGGYDCKIQHPRVNPRISSPRLTTPRPVATRPTSPNVYTPRSCPRGYRRTQNGGCTDIDECAERTHSCDDYQDCQNIMGGHRCNCRSGFYKDPLTLACMDINECQRNDLNDCTESQRCDNSIGSYHCIRYTSCGTGYTLNSASSKCEDDNECELGTHDCNSLGPQFECMNLPGTYRCVRVATTTTTTTTTEDYDSEEYYVYSEEYHGNDTNKKTNDINEPKPSPKSTNSPSYNEVHPLPPDDARPRTNIPDPRYTQNYKPQVYFPDPTEPSSTTSSSTLPPIFRGIRPPPLNNLPATVVGSPDDQGNIIVDTKDLPENKWTKIVPGEKFCIAGYTKDELGQCIDLDECKTERHICRPNSEICLNTQGGYTCLCAPGYVKNLSNGLCVSQSQSGLPVPIIPRWSLGPTKSCNIGYQIDTSTGECVDINECADGTSRCASNEVCSNTLGGFRCQCKEGFLLIDGRCQSQYKPTYRDPRPSSRPIYRPSTQIVTVTSAPRYVCPRGFKLNDDHKCTDIDECAQGVHTCLQGQQCINAPGGYMCRCPTGHRLSPNGGCEDIDECTETGGKSCSPYATCVNTVGSFRCDCREGFKQSDHSHQLCTDVDECNGGKGPCHQQCINVWGSYRCACDRGYRLHTDNRTCIDIDECSEQRLVCVGECQNIPGSYKCTCPKGYRMGMDGRSCIDIDECETGESVCREEEICQNSRGGAHCRSVACPPGYTKEPGSKHRCRRTPGLCRLSDLACLRAPNRYSFNFITFVSKLYIPTGPRPQVDLFTMRAPSWNGAMLSFDLKLVEARAPEGVEAANMDCFRMTPSSQQAVVSLVKSLPGPQDIQLELSMELYTFGQYEGTAVAKIFIFVSPYEF